MMKYTQRQYHATVTNRSIISTGVGILNEHIPHLRRPLEGEVDSAILCQECQELEMHTDELPVLIPPVDQQLWSYVQGGRGNE